MRKAAKRAPHPQPPPVIPLLIVFTGTAVVLLLATSAASPRIVETATTMLAALAGATALRYAWPRRGVFTSIVMNYVLLGVAAGTTWCAFALWPAQGPPVCWGPTSGPGSLSCEVLAAKGSALASVVVVVISATAVLMAYGRAIHQHYVLRTSR